MSVYTSYTLLDCAYYSHSLEQLRHRAGRLLRAARFNLSAGDSNAIELAASLLPHSSTARRMLIQSFILSHSFTRADRLIAVGLLMRPTSPVLAMMHAHVHLKCGRLELARGEIRLAMEGRPNHIGTLLLAADIELACTNHHEAVRLLRRACSFTRVSDRQLNHIIQRLLESGEFDLASRALRLHSDPPGMLRAELLIAQRRYRSAADILKKLIEEGGCAADRAFDRYVEVLETTMDWPQLREVLTRFEHNSPSMAARSAKVRLLFGHFAPAISLSRRAVRSEAHRLTGHVVRCVAATLLGRNRLAERTFHRIGGLNQSQAVETFSECWKRGMLGRLIAEQSSAKLASKDPSRGVLLPLVEHAAGTLQDYLASNTSGADGATLSPLQTHVTRCLDLLGANQPDTVMPAAGDGSTDGPDVLHVLGGPDKSDNSDQSAEIAA